MLSPSQTIATFKRGIWQHSWVQHVSRVWPPCQIFHAIFLICGCCMIHCGSRFGQVCATMLRLGMRTSLICRDTSTGWPNARNVLRPTMLRFVALKCYDCLAGACKCWTNNIGICCVDMLRSFGRGLTNNVLEKHQDAYDSQFLGTWFKSKIDVSPSGFGSWFSNEQGRNLW